MPAEKQNNISDKLNAMRSLPEGYNFHPDKVWNRLEPQLKKTTINYRAVFFAAASFLALIVFIAIPSNRNDKSGPMVSEQVQNDPVKSPVENPVTISNNTSPVSVDRRSETSPSSPLVLGNSKAPVVDQPLRDIVIKTEIIPQKREENPAPELNPETPPAVTASVSVKPKRRFPIAHANELNKVIQVEEEEPVSRSKTGFAFRKLPYDAVTPVTSFEEGFTDRKKQKSIFPLLNSSQ